MAKPYPVRFESNIPVMMRDGVITYVDVYRPEPPGRFPALLLRTPYDRTSANSKVVYLDAVRAAMNGYAAVLQDVRGRFGSEGEFDPFVNEIVDGYDSVEWAAGQPWCTGKVGMYGVSYHGATQWLAAMSKPPSLVSIAPGCIVSDFHGDLIWQGGAFGLGVFLYWAMATSMTNWASLSRRLGLPPEQLDSLIDAYDNLGESYRHLPLKEVPALKANMTPFYYYWLDHPEYDDYWKRICVEESYSEITVPALNYSGWYDSCLGGTIRGFVGMHQMGATEEARRGQRLVIGPWVHGGSPTNLSGEYNFGTRASSADLDLHGMILRHHDYWLKGEDNGVADEKPVRIFVMGENVWRWEDEWPLSRAEEVSYYLHSQGKANTLNGDGWLSPESPGDEPPDAYVYNPIDPVPTRGGGVCCDPAWMPWGAFDQRPVEARPDVLVYSTPPLEQDTEVTGPITVRLYASTSARDTDFTAKLVDVEPSGYARNLTDGIIRARYRQPRAPASLIQPGQVYEYTIDLWATSNLFKKGHRIRLEIASSNFPRFDRNTNTGEAIGTDAEVIPALQTVYHTPGYSSHVTLPIVPRA